MQSADEESDGIGAARQLPDGPSDHRRRARTAAIGVTITVGFLASVVLYAWAMGGAHDSRSLDNSAIRQAATTGCLRVTDAIDDARIDRRQTIDAGNAAIADLVATVEAVGAATLDDDPPASDWLNDWRRMAEARTVFADNLADAETESFVAPETDDGYPIAERMVEVAPTECERAVQLAAAP